MERRQSALFIEYPKNHWTKYGLICIHFDAIFNTQFICMCYVMILSTHLFTTVIDENFAFDIIENASSPCGLTYISSMLLVSLLYKCVLFPHGS